MPQSALCPGAELLRLMLQDPSDPEVEKFSNTSIWSLSPLLSPCLTSAKMTPLLSKRPLSPHQHTLTFQTRLHLLPHVLLASDPSYCES